MYEAAPLMTLISSTIRKGSVKILFLFIEILRQPHCRKYDRESILNMWKALLKYFFGKTS